MVVGDGKPFIAALITIDPEAIAGLGVEARQADATSRRWPTTRT